MQIRVLCVVGAIILTAAALVAIGQRTPAKNSSRAVAARTASSNAIFDGRKIVRPEKEWKKILTADAFYVLRQKGTERAYTGSLTDNKKAGTYACAACGLHLFSSAHKFDSEQAREAGRKGGKAAHERGTAHEFDSEEARAAGRKGGEASHRRRNGGSSANKRLFPPGDSSEQRADAGREAIKAPGRE